MTDAPRLTLLDLATMEADAKRYVPGRNGAKQAANVIALIAEVRLAWQERDALIGQDNRPAQAKAVEGWND